MRFRRKKTDPDATTEAKPTDNAATAAKEQPTGERTAASIRAASGARPTTGSHPVVVPVEERLEGLRAWIAQIERKLASAPTPVPRPSCSRSPRGSSAWCSRSAPRTRAQPRPRSRRCSDQAQQLPEGNGQRRRGGPELGRRPPRRAREPRRHGHRRPAHHGQRAQGRPGRHRRAAHRCLEHRRHPARQLGHGLGHRRQRRHQPLSSDGRTHLRSCQSARLRTPASDDGLRSRQS